jgi:hypothetical protein
MIYHLLPEQNFRVILAWMPGIGGNKMADAIAMDATV